MQSSYREHDVRELFTNSLPHSHRYNKYLKNLVRTGYRTSEHLAQSAAIDIATSYIHLCGSLRKYDTRTDPNHNCFLKQKKRRCTFSRREVGDLRMLGLFVDTLEINAFAVANIMGVHFRAGQWGRRPTCSSVITCVVNGRSVYGYVNKFLHIDRDDCPGYAAVTWFGIPQYPLGRNRLEVVVSSDSSILDREIGCIIRITQIDPSPIIVEPDGDNYRMMRLSGFDRVGGR